MNEDPFSQSDEGQGSPKDVLGHSLNLKMYGLATLLLCLSNQLGVVVHQRAFRKSKIIVVTGLIRRLLVAVWFYLPGHLIVKVGDLKTTVVSLFLFCVSFFDNTIHQHSILGILGLFWSSIFSQQRVMLFLTLALQSIFQSLDIKQARP